jgi:hypothetical protein
MSSTEEREFSNSKAASYPISFSFTESILKSAIQCDSVYNLKSGSLMLRHSK